MLLHADHICNSTKNVIIHAPETDVVIIAIIIFTEISSNLCILTGTKTNARIILVEKVKQSLILLHYHLQDKITFKITIKLLHIFWKWHSECILW